MQESGSSVVRGPDGHVFDWGPKKREEAPALGTSGQEVAGNLPHEERKYGSSHKLGRVVLALVAEGAVPART